MEKGKNCRKIPLKRRETVAEIMEKSVNNLYEKLIKYGGIKNIREIMGFDDFMYQTISYILSKSRRNHCELLIIQNFLKSFPKFMEKIKQNDLFNSLTVLF